MIACAQLMYERCEERRPTRRPALPARPPRTTRRAKPVGIFRLPLVQLWRQGRDGGVNRLDAQLAIEE